MSPAQEGLDAFREECQADTAQGCANELRQLAVEERRLRGDGCRLRAQLRRARLATTLAAALHRERFGDPTLRSAAAPAASAATSAAASAAETREAQEAREGRETCLRQECAELRTLIARLESEVAFEESRAADVGGNALLGATPAVATVAHGADNKEARAEMRRLAQLEAFAERLHEDVRRAPPTRSNAPSPERSRSDSGVGVGVPPSRLTLGFPRLNGNTAASVRSGFSAASAKSDRLEGQMKAFRARFLARRDGYAAR